MAERARGARPRSADEPKTDAAPNVVEVEAKDLTINDQIFFPNSRKPQAIVAITEEPDGVRRVMAEGAEWLVGHHYKVRRVVSS